MIPTVGILLVFLSYGTSLTDTLEQEMPGQNRVGQN